MACGRQFCRCGDELIHRDRRRWYESSSALGALIRHVGPAEIAAGDIVRGNLGSNDSHPREVVFAGPQQVELLNGTVVTIFETNDEFATFINGGSGWTVRNGIARVEFRNAG